MGRECRNLPLLGENKEAFARKAPREVENALRNIRHMALDLDGTVYTGKQIFSCTEPFLKTLERMEIGYTFLTNNSSRNASDYVTHLKEMGIDAKRDGIFTSGDATIEYLREEMPEARRIFMLGTASLETQFADAGYVLCRDTAEDVPDAVIIGFDSTLSYDRLCRAAYWVQQGLPYLATHPDLVCPTPEPTLLVDCGAICAAVERATGRLPDVVPGKPNQRMLRGILRRYGLEPHHLAMVGDRLYTDMVMAHECGALGILVLSGETTAEQAKESARRPDLMVQDLGELDRLLQTTWRIDNAEPTSFQNQTQRLFTTTDPRTA